MSSYCQRSRKLPQQTSPVSMYHRHPRCFAVIPPALSYRQRNLPSGCCRPESVSCLIHRSRQNNNSICCSLYRDSHPHWRHRIAIRHRYTMSVLRLFAFPIASLTGPLDYTPGNRPLPSPAQRKRSSGADPALIQIPSITVVTESLPRFSPAPNNVPSSNKAKLLYPYRIAEISASKVQASSLCRIPPSHTILTLSSTFLGFSDKVMNILTLRNTALSKDI